MRHIGNSSLYLFTNGLYQNTTHTYTHNTTPQTFQQTLHYTSSGGFASSTSASSFISIGIGIDALLPVLAFAT